MVKVDEFRRATPGLIRAIGKAQTKKSCAACEFPIPVYPGRYPKTCPNCGEPAIKDQGATDVGEDDGTSTTAA